MTTGTLSINQGDYFTYSDVATDLYGNVLNVSGMSGLGFVKLHYAGNGILDYFNITLNPPSGYTISLNPSGTSKYPVCQGVYGVYIFSSGTGEFNIAPYQAQIAQGYINVFPELCSNFTGLYIQRNTGNCWGNIDGGTF